MNINTLSKWEIINLVREIGGDIISSQEMDFQREQRHHGSISCFDHSFTVAYLSVWIADRFSVSVDINSLIRGALLHDYYLYDSKNYAKSSYNHLIQHAKTALSNAVRDYDINEIEKNIISRHMFPITCIPPKYRESVIVNIADKISASLEFAYAVIPAARLRKAIIKENI